MKASEIRSKWLEFFSGKNHKIEPSASLVPHNDPSLLWINAGMAPLKAYFDGRTIPDNRRIANSQKCIRTNDIEEVGKTRRHQTFFEMLGNFSIGDYFKEEAIVWAWEFLTDPQWIGFDPDKLYVTVYPDDTEAYEFWKNKVGLPEQRIYKLEDNFWDIGEGPCGPCSEIFYDRGPAYGDLSDAEGYPGGENERFLEVWNLVFSQFNHNKDGSYTPLPNKNIDTGAGLERLASILQNVDSNFDTDLFQPIIARIGLIAGVSYGRNTQTDIALKIMADHIRTVVFAVGDGVLPSNEGRGYVIRRLLRRAVRYGKKLGVDRPFLYELTETVGEIMGGYYPEVVEQRAFIEKVIRTEEERFHETLSDGLSILEQWIKEAQAENRSGISGADAFKLYDTYGFPLDLTEDYAAEHAMTVDREGFSAAMEEQRTRARAARHDSESMNVQGGALADITVKSEFVGYNELETTAQLLVLFVDQEPVDQVSAGQTFQAILDRTPFYAESGGQVSDQGALASLEGAARAVVEGVGKAPHGQHIVTAKLLNGQLRAGDKVVAVVERASRERIVKNHTATHLLHKALKQVLGTHVNQAGSLVEAERLRFDFSHFGAMEAEQIERVERLVNEQIWNNIDVHISTKPLAEAKAMGAMALFGEKYGEVVRVVQVGDYSLELCGGCHVGNTAEIGLFKIVSENGIGSGIRRIEAVTSRGAFEYIDRLLTLLQHSAEQLKTKAEDLPKRIETLQHQYKELQRENDSLRGKLSHVEAAALSGRLRQINGIPLLAEQVDASDMDALRSLVDQMKAKLGSAVIVLGAVHDGKVNLVAAVTDDLIARGINAGKLIKPIAAVVDGSGGGRADLAQAGGKNAEKLQEALAQVKSMLI